MKNYRTTTEEQLNDIIILGSVGIDAITTPYGTVRDALGGSAVYSALAAAKFAPPSASRQSTPQIVSVVGRDFPPEYLDFLRTHNVSTNWLVIVDAPTFRWEGRYEFDMGVAKTLKTSLGSLAQGEKVTKGYQKLLEGTKDYAPKFLLLANFNPEIQLEIAVQFRGHGRDGFIVLDTMNYWIETKLDALTAVIKHVDALLLNENEARELFDTTNLVKAGHAALLLGPQFVIIKKGEHGAMLFSHEGFFTVPGYPLLEPIDPTGAGDSFAGTLSGVLAHPAFKETGVKFKGVTFKAMRRALVYATAMSSFTVEGMGPSRLATLKPEEIEERVEVFRGMREF